MKFDTKEVERHLKRLERESPKELKKLVNRVAVAGLDKIKTSLPKRSGNLRRSYVNQSYRGDKYARILKSKLESVAEAVEGGTRARTIRAKRAKFLTIPTTDAVLTKSKSQIKKLSNKAFSAAVKRGDIVLAKKANLPKRAGKKILERQVLPFINKRIEREAKLTLGRLVR